MFKYRSLHDGNNGLVGSGIHFRSSHIKSKSLKNEFENRTVRGTFFFWKKIGNLEIIVYLCPQYNNQSIMNNEKCKVFHLLDT